MLEQRKQTTHGKQWNFFNSLQGGNHDSNASSNQFSQNTLFSKSSDLQLPTSLPVMLGIAIFGHAFWNGSSVLMSHISRNLNPVVGLFAELIWIVVLITLLWTVGRFVIAAAMEEGV